MTPFDAILNRLPVNVKGRVLRAVETMMSPGKQSTIIEYVCTLVWFALRAVAEELNVIQIRQQALDQRLKEIERKLEGK